MLAENRIIAKMLDRLFAGLVNGPSLNCKPHSSRQRVDWMMLGKFKDLSPETSLGKLLGEDKSVKLTGRTPLPKRVEAERLDDRLTPEERATKQAWADQQSLLSKLRGIAEDARTYEQDTGVHVLNIGFPLLCLPPGAAGGKQRGASKRIVAPIAFIPVSIVLKTGASCGVTIACKGEGVDRVTPNTALLAWLEQQTGKPPGAELFADEEGSDPWREIGELVRHVCGMLEIEVPGEFTEKKSEAGSEKREGLNTTGAPASAEEVEHSRADPSQAQDDGSSDMKPHVHATVEASMAAFSLVPPPRAEDGPEKPAILLSAVLGLFPVANQGLLRDMQALNGGEAVAGPITSFIHAAVSLDAASEAPAAEAAAQPIARKTRAFAQERLIAQADPCQSRAVKLARTARGLVIHGPPGTGKSQTITNIIGDHLSRGLRVLLVSDKRTALDVVANRLEHMGLGRLVALIHDPQRDQRDLYRAIREQLETLAETTTNEKAEKQLAKVDGELQELHNELTGYWDALMREEGAPDCGANVAPANLEKAAGTAAPQQEKLQHAESFHTLVGQWLATGDSPESSRLEGIGDAIDLGNLDHHAHLIDETFARAAKVQWSKNPWREAAGIELGSV